MPQKILRTAALGVTTFARFERMDLPFGVGWENKGKSVVNALRDPQDSEELAVQR